MLTIDKTVLQNSELKETAMRATWEMGSMFLAQGSKVDSKLILAAYLLYVVSTNPSSSEISYSQLFTLDLGLSPDAEFAIKENISSKEWESLLQLTEKYPPEIFAVIALTYDLSNEFKTSGSEATPESVVRLAQRILQVKPQDNVADVCCGYGTFLCESALDEPSANYTGFEINTTNRLIAEIRTRLVSDTTSINLKDVFDLIDDNHLQQYDKIFSNYPFKLPLRHLGGGAKYITRLNERFPGVSKATSSDWVFNSLLCELLADDGKAVAIMTNGSTSNGIDTPMRKHFVENGLIESVIALPGRMFYTTAIATTMIVFSKGNKNVRIVDASKICHQGRRYNEFTDEDIDTIMTALRNDGENSKVIDLTELRQNEYTLSLSRYLTESITFANAVPFESVIRSITRGAPCTARELDEMASDKPTDMQYLMLANIQNGIIDDNLPYLSHIDAKYEKYCLKDNHLILSKNGYPYKIAIAKIQEGQRILANGNLYIIELDEDKVNPYYLKAFFESEQGIAVLKSITVGATIPNIGVDKLKKVEIPLPSLEVQKRIAERYQATLDEIAAYKSKMEKAMNLLHHIFDEESGK